MASSQEGTVLEAGWKFQPIAPGTKLAEPAPLYTKLDPLPEATV